MQRDILALLPEMLILGGAVVVLLAGSFLPRDRQFVTRVVAIVALSASAGTAIIGLAEPARTLLERSFALDDATGLARLIIPLATILVIVLGVDEWGATPRESETYTLLLLTALGAMVMAGGSDLMILSTGYLLASIPLYALIGLSRSPGAAEAALKTYLVGALLGIALLVGVAVLYGVGGGTSYGQIQSALEQAPPAAVAAGAVGVLAGLMFKAGGVPGHFWVPDSTQVSGPAAAAFFTSIPKVGALVAAFRVVDLMPSSIDVPLLVGVIAAATMTLGNFAAFWQDDVRRLLGWSTVSQVGYLLLPVAVAGRTDLALPSLMLYLAGYAVTNVTAFAVVAAVPERRSIADYRGVAASHPWLAGALVVSLLSLVGTPPTVVFVGKLTTFAAAWDGGLAWLVVIAAVNTVASLFYYLRWLAPMFAGDPAGTRTAGTRTVAPRTVAPSASWAARAAVAGAAVVVGLGVFAGPVMALVGSPIAR